MLIIGAKGFAKEVLEILYQLKDLDNIAFFDDINKDIPNVIFDKFKVLKSINEASAFFKNVDKRFTIGIGNPYLRSQLDRKFTSIGGVLASTISPKAEIGHFGNRISFGCNIMTGTVLTNDIAVGKGVLINLNCTVGHDSIIGDFTEISPGVNISGNCKIGSYVTIGTNATILPKITIGNNVIIAAGAVVIKDIPDNCMVAGVPAIIKKELTPLVNKNE